MPSLPISDFRSDTVTRPDEAMRAAMAEAVVGDDVFGDDPTVAALEAEVAQLLGKPAAVFFPSGTMANQAAVRCHTRPGDEVLLHRDCHVYRFEQGGLAALHGVQAVPLPGPGGQVPVDDFAAHLRPVDQHFPRSSLVVIENTHNFCGGTILPGDYIDQVGAFCRAQGLALHLDGARLLNAAAALAVDPRSLVEAADTVSLCLSKGLGAPVGTVLCGSDPLMGSARRARKLLGGAMRQTGILAAAARCALVGWRDRLLADHRRAQQFATAALHIPGVLGESPDTNLVILRFPGHDVASVLTGLGERGVRAVGFGAGRIRFAFHRDVQDEDVERALLALAQVLDRRPK